MNSLFKVRYVPVYMTDLQYMKFLINADKAGGSVLLASHLFHTGLIASKYYSILKSNSLPKVPNEK